MDTSHEGEGIHNRYEHTPESRKAMDTISGTNRGMGPRESYSNATAGVPGSIGTDILPGGSSNQPMDVSGDSDTGGYEGPYTLEDDITEVGVVLPAEALDDVDLKDLREIRDEEDPYLGQTGMLDTEDIIDQRSDVDLQTETRLSGYDENDVFGNAMDVDVEDLESFTEDLDDDIDAAAFTSEVSIDEYELSDDGSLVNESRPIEHKEQ